jgi:ElaB/YqjD/DUF883 family membrane-anchored ribosome-binding protein
MTDLSLGAANGVAHDHSLAGDPLVADITARSPVNDAAGATEKALSETLSAALREARAMFDVKAQALTEQARDAFATLKAEAEKRSAQGVEVVRARPYAAVGAAAVAGFLLGHLINTSRPQVVYLKDHR